MGTKQKSQQIWLVLIFSKFFHSNLVLLAPKKKFYFQIYEVIQLSTHILRDTNLITIDA